MVWTMQTDPVQSQLQRPLAEAGHAVPHYRWHVAGALVIEHLGFASENLVQTPL